MDLRWKGFNRKKINKFKMSKFSPLGGGGVSEAKLEKAHMTHDDWMALTNRPDVVEKDMVKLLDWFIKVDLLEDDVLYFFVSDINRTTHLVEFPNSFTKISFPPQPQARGWLRSCSEYWTRTTEDPSDFRRYRRSNIVTLRYDFELLTFMILDD